jgi:hypothetical protein
MTPQPWDDNQYLMDDLAEAFASVSATADAVAQRAQGALAWLTVDEDLMRASLSFDSSQGAAGILRAEAANSRALVFSASPLSVELEINAQGALGQIMPPGTGEIYVEASDGEVIRASADDLGFFVLPRLPGCPVRLRCETATGKLVTDWFTVA